MGLNVTYNEAKSPTAGKLGIWEQYDRSLETLAARCLGEPYNFYRIDVDVCSPMLGETFHGKIVAACQAQFRKESRYSAHSVAAQVNTTIETLTSLAQKDAELDLPTAFDFFRTIWGQFVEVQIADFVSGWVMQGKSSEEIQVLSSNMRREKGATARATGSDGIAEFEAKLFAALDGKKFEYPVKPHLAKMRKLIQDYAPGDYIVVAALSGVGKSYYGLNTMAYNVLNGVPSCYVNLEMSPADVQKRLWQMASGEHFRRDLVTNNDEVTMARLAAWERVKKNGIVSRNPGRSLAAVLSTIRYEWNERGIQFAVIDYAQLLNIPGYRGARNYELGEVSAELRALALELNIPIMVMAQLKQEVVKYANRRGGLYDIKDCANFAQDATFVHVLHRPNVHLDADEVSDHADDYADVTTVKGRETGTARAECRFDPINGFGDASDNFFAKPFSPTAPAATNYETFNSHRKEPEKEQETPF